jgi:hypothetical protein
MSSRNKVNPGQYTQAGRLSPDDAAREQRKMNPQSGPSNREAAAADAEERHPPERDDKPGREDENSKS